MPVLVLAVFFSFYPAAGLTAQDITHVVGRGETIFSIAQSFNVDRNELMKLNGITDPTKLQAGQKLKIPGGSGPGSTGLGSAGPGSAGLNSEAIVNSAANTGSPDLLYNTARGDTFYSIAKKYNVSVSDILAANNLSSNYMLKQGDVLLIPGTVLPSIQIQPPMAAAPAAIPAQVTDTKAADPDLSIRWPVTAKELIYMTGKSSGVMVTGLVYEPVKSLTSGTVISAGPYRGYGRVAIVQAPGGYIYVYGGCDSLTVKEGDKVGPGMEMGRLGFDPITEKPQLFLRVYLNNIPVDPAKAPRA
ncbi:MAG: LysM peptidoglycan-binding domain-containing protein [Treponema sp.]|nr:LysM peptidoglycan-binding domain-containing protein [Treponema sp.]